MVDLPDVRAIMNAAFALLLEFEMFDRIGDIGLRTVNSGLAQRGVKHLSCGANKGLPLQIFLIAWLLANKHQLCALRPFAKDDLGRRTK